QSPFPQSTLSYVAFRVAFLQTFEIFSQQKHLLGECSDSRGYLCEVPFLQEVAPAVQLELLATTWQKHQSRDIHRSDLIDESVIYAACEMTARAIENDPDSVLRSLVGGPANVAVPLDSYLAREIRLLYLELPNDCDFLLVSQFLDLDPEDAIDQKLQMGIDPNRMLPMFEALGRWHISPQIIGCLRGLLSEVESARVATILRVPCLT
ncbi:MAG: hypothetical protein WCJ92_08520, partial [Alphaproteobacteria bacterium]